jgi:murein DD-endopeptidase MepM/ murein hydrolase activator NlpD
MSMNKAVDVAQAVKALIDIIKAGLKGGWAGAALAALKAYWPKLVPVAIVIVLLPAIITVALPAILLGFAGSDEEEKAAEVRSWYGKYEEFRNSLIEVIVSQQGVSCKVEFLNDTFDEDWLIAIDSVRHDNDLNKMSEQDFREFIGKTFTFEVAETPSEEQKVTEPYDDTAHRLADEPAPEDKPKDVIVKITTLSPTELMRKLEFSEEKRNWAEMIFETYSAGRDDLNPDGMSKEVDDLIVDDNTPMSDKGFISPFVGIRWQDRVTSEYGVRKDPVTGKPKANHTGLDLGVPLGTPIHAVASGTVLYVRDSENGGYGKHLAINHGVKIVTLYGHCSEILVKTGDKVTQG